MEEKLTASVLKAPKRWMEYKVRADHGKNDETIDRTVEMGSAWHIYSYKNG